MRPLLAPLSDAPSPPGSEVPGTRLSKKHRIKDFTATDHPRLLADKIYTSGDGSAGESKQVTVVFGDLCWSAGAKNRPPEEVYRYVEGLFRRVSDIVEQYHGSVAKVAGDHFRALFGAPIALEDHASCACSAALALNMAVADLARRAERDRAPQLSLRLGVYTDRALIDSTETAARADAHDLGTPAGWAALVRQRAMPGSIVVAENTYHLVKDLFEFRPLWHGPLQGQPLLFELTATRFRTKLQAAEVKGLSRFVGRERELNALKAAVEKAGAGYRHVIQVVGDAGVGKSRLVLELRRTLSHSDVLFLEGHCATSGSQTSYLPFIEMLKQYAGIEPGGPAETTREKVGACLKGLPSEDDFVPALCEVLSLPVDEAFIALEPKIKRELIFRALTAVLAGGARKDLVVAVLEDLHWIDRSSEQFLAHLITHAENTKLCLILVHRPEYSAREDLGRTEVLHLDRIAPDSAMGLVRSILGDHAVASDAIAFILDRSDGNPLFIEEITHSLVEQGLIELNGEQYTLSEGLASIQTPAIIEAVIAGRMDRLKTSTKRTAQAASVIGRGFSLDLLSAALHQPGTLHEDLATLERSEFIYRAMPFQEERYVFKHALTQEVAYRGMLGYRRRDLHERVAAAIESLNKNRLDAVCEALAHHYFAAEMWDNAYTYLMLSAEKAKRRNAPEEAYHLYKDALIAIRKMPEGGRRVREQMEVLLAIHWAARMIHMPEVKTHLLDGERLAETLNDAKSLALFRSALAVLHQAVGDSAGAREYARKCLLLAEQIGELLVDEHALAVLVPFAADYSGLCYVTGRYREAVALNQVVIEALERLPLEREGLGNLTGPYINLLATNAICWWSLGRFDLGREFTEKARKSVKILGNYPEAAWVDIVYGYFLYASGLWEEATPVCHSLLKRLEDGTMGPNWAPTIWALSGGVAALAGDWTIAHRHLEKSCRLAIESGVVMFLPYTYCDASLVELELKYADEALELAQQAVEWARRNNERPWEGFAFVCLGKVMGQPQFHRFSEAESSILRGITILEEAGVKPYAARGYLYLGELYSNAGRKALAKKYLKRAAKLYREMDIEYWLSRTRDLLTNL